MHSNRTQADPTATRMARAMQDIAATGATVDRDALGLRGFTAAEIDAHHRAARDIANKRAVRQGRAGA